MDENSNNKESFISAYEEYSQAIFRYCLFRVYDRERAKELMQETFTKTWEYLSEGKEVQNMKAFLYKVAHNLCVNDAIRRKPYSLDEMKENAGFDIKDTLTRTPEDNIEIDMLLKNMQMLKSGDRDILTMRYVDDLKVSEIAELLDALPNTISVKLTRAENTLRKMYEENKK